jgi:hypothetical protein
MNALGFSRVDFMSSRKEARISSCECLWQRAACETRPLGLLSTKLHPVLQNFLICKSRAPRTLSDAPSHYFSPLLNRNFHADNRQTYSCHHTFLSLRKRRATFFHLKKALGNSIRLGTYYSLGRYSGIGGFFFP